MIAETASPTPNAIHEMEMAKTNTFPQNPASCSVIFPFISMIIFAGVFMLKSLSCFMDILSIREKQKAPDCSSNQGLLFYAMQQKSPRNSEALSYGCIYAFWKLTRIMHRFFCMVKDLFCFLCTFPIIRRFPFSPTP